MFWEIFIPTFASFWLVMGIKSAARMQGIMQYEKKGGRLPFYKKFLLIAIALGWVPITDGYADGIQDFE